MNFSWMAALYQIVFILIVILFFAGLYKFVNRLIQHTKNTEESLRRLEEKIDRLNHEMNKTE
ncbi:hypothetical protein J21TS3_19120 [Paenibacillus cookii]|uniref:DUF4083 domain-containing protein n=2 Tax=Paenibacillus TaxID=44249 RepID=A0ABQ4LUZ8_9BACL|nr:hypothetical protein J21TS3_19120 [Paenibacillus cookii]